MRHARQRGARLRGVRSYLAAQRERDHRMTNDAVQQKWKEGYDVGYADARRDYPEAENPAVTREFAALQERIRTLGAQVERLRDANAGLHACLRTTWDPMDPDADEALESFDAYLEELLGNILAHHLVPRLESRYDPSLSGHATDEDGSKRQPDERQLPSDDEGPDARSETVDAVDVSGLRDGLVERDLEKGPEVRAAAAIHGISMNHTWQS